MQSTQTLCYIRNKMPGYRTSHRTLDYIGVTLWFIWCHLFCKTMRVILKWTLNKQGGRAWSWLIWLSKRQIGRLLSIWSCIFVLCKLWGISWLAEELLAPLYRCWPMTLRYLYYTAVGWSYYQVKSPLHVPSWILDDLYLHGSTIFWPKTHMLSIVTKIQLPSVNTYSQCFLYLILTNQSDVCTVSNE